jgi:hypothetical protein
VPSPQPDFELSAVSMGHVGLDGPWLHVHRRLCEITGSTVINLFVSCAFAVRLAIYSRGARDSAVSQR